MSDLRAEMIQQLTTLFEAQRAPDGLALMADLHPADVADVLEHLPIEAQLVYFKALDPEKRSEVLLELEEAQQKLIFQQLSSAELAQLLLNMDSDDAADLIADLPSEKGSAVLTRIDEEDQQEVRKLLTYPEDSAGGLMQMEVVSVPQEVTISQARNLVREQAKVVEDFANVFVVSGDRHVIGVLSLRDLLLADPSTPVTEVLNPMTASIRPDEDQEKVAHLFQKYDLISAPVVDHRGRLLGRVTVDDVVDVIQKEASEDIYRMVGADDEELAVGERIFKIAGLRLPWILTNLFGGVLTGYLLWLFKTTLAETLILVSFVPVITAMGGNVGLQTATIFVRSMALGSYSASKLSRVLFREIRIAAVMGVTCALLAGGVAAVWHGRLSLGLIVGLAMLSCIISASTVGILAPAFFRRIKVDPAIASGPWVTTANDIMGILIYLGIATLFLRYVIV